MASTQYIEERQKLQSLQRDEKTSARSLSTLQDNFKRMEERKNELDEQASDLGDKKTEVCLQISAIFHVLTFAARTEGRRAAN